MKQSTRKMALLGLLAMLALAPTLRAEEADNSATDDQEEMRAMLGSMTAQLNDLKNKSDNGVNFGVNSDLRYDYQPYKGYTSATSNTVTASTYPNAVANGVAGMYAKRIEVEFKAKPYSWQTWHLQFDFAGLKLEDLGVEMNDLPILGDFTYDAKIGQFRQPFGIEQQTGSSSIAFSERAMMYGGASPFPNISKLVTERVMGVHAMQKHAFGPIGYTLQVAVANDNSDMNPGSTSLGGASPLNTTWTPAVTVFPSNGQRTDNDPSEFARLGLDLNFIPGISKLNFGASAIHDSLDAQFFAVDPVQQKWAETYGADFTLETLGFWHLQGEFVGKNTFAGGNTSVDKKGAESKGWYYFGLTRSEGYYVTSVMEPLKLFIKDPTKLELNFRYDDFTNDVNLLGRGAAAGGLGQGALPGVAANVQAVTTGLKWSFVGKNYTSINYTTYGLNGDFGASGPAKANLWVLQQQFNY